MARADQELTQRILALLAERPRDAVEIAAALAEAGGTSVTRHAGRLHALLHQLLRHGRIRLAGFSARAIWRYALPGEGGEAGTDAPAPPPVPACVHPRIARLAARVASGVRDPADRGRVHAEVLEHLRALDAHGGLRRFGSDRAARHLLQRADRGRPFVAFVGGFGDALHRFVLHEGPWILAAILAFLLVRGFVAEVFVIPSGSMEPTLAIGDRVVVFKPGGRKLPERFRIVTYARRGTTYVKRVAGLGGEAIRLEEGDVYADGRLVVKPEEVREALRFPYRAFDLPDPDPGVWEVVEEGGERSYAFAGPTLHAGGDLGGGPAGRDVRLRDVYLDLETERGPGERVALDLLYRADGGAGVPPFGTGPWRRFTLAVTDRGVRLLAEGPGGEVRLLAEREGAGAPGAVALSLAQVDGVLHARAPGLVHAAALPEDLRPPRGARLEPGARLPRRATARLLLDKDVHYTGAGALGVPPAEPFQVPEGHVFCLGDNTYDSQDSRFRDVGPIPLGELVGPVVLRLWPPTRLGRVR